MGQRICGRKSRRNQNAQRPSFAEGSLKPDLCELFRSMMCFINLVSSSIRMDQVATSKYGFR